MTVLVVPEDVRHGDLGAVHRRVVGDLHLERHGVTELERLVLLRCHELHLRGQGAHREDDLGRGPPAGRVGHLQRRAVVTVRGECVRRVGLAGVHLAVAVEVPGVRQRVAVRVGRAGAGEGHRQRGLAGGRRGRDLRDRGPVAAHVVDPGQLGVRVLGEVAVAVLQDVERAVRPELQVHRVVEDDRRQDRVDAGHLLAVVQVEALDVVAGPLVEQRQPVELGRPLGRRGAAGVVLVRRSTHRPDAAGAQQRPRGAGAVRVDDLGLLHRRQVRQPGVVRRVVDRRRAVERRARGRGGEVVVVVRHVRCHAVRPAVVGRLVDRHPAALPGRSPVRVGRVGVRRVVTDVRHVRGLVDGEPERVAQAHREDLGPGVGGADLEQVAGRDAVAAVALDLDPQQLAAQVVGVARGPLGVEGRVAVGPLVDRHEAVRGERVGVVAGGQVQVAVTVEVDLAADVAADAAVDRHREDLLLGVQLQGVAGQLEPGQLHDALERREVGGLAGLRRVTLVDARRRRVVGRGVQHRRVVDVDPLVGGEIGVDGDALHAFLVVLVDRDLGGQDVQAGLGVVDPDLTGTGGVQHPLVRQHGQGDRLAREVVEGDLLEVRVGRQRMGLRLHRQHDGRGGDDDSGDSYLESAHVRTAIRRGSRSRPRRSSAHRPGFSAGCPRRRVPRCTRPGRPRGRGGRCGRSRSGRCRGRRTARW